MCNCVLHVIEGHWSKDGTILLDRKYCKYGIVTANTGQPSKLFIQTEPEGSIPLLHYKMV